MVSKAMSDRMTKQEFKLGHILYCTSKLKVCPWAKQSAFKVDILEILPVKSLNLTSIHWM